MHLEIEPPELLRDAIRCFWHDSKDFGEAPVSFEVVPDGYAEIIFHFGSGCGFAENGEVQSLPSPFMVGLLNRPAVFYTQHRLEIIGIRCFPWTVFDLLGLPPGKKSVHTFAHPVAQLQPLLAGLLGSGDIDGALAAVSTFFLDARAHVTTDSMLFKAGEAMRRAGGTLPVRDVAAAAHATVRTLERNFRQSSGHTVKDVSALMRFEQVRNRLWNEPGSSLAALAYEFGYTDQAHLGREFKRYTGTTPGAFARKAKQRQKVYGNDFVAFVQT